MKYMILHLETRVITSLYEGERYKYRGPLWKNQSLLGGILFCGQIKETISFLPQIILMFPYLTAGIFLEVQDFRILTTSHQVAQMYTQRPEVFPEKARAKRMWGQRDWVLKSLTVWNFYLLQPENWHRLSHILKMSCIYQFE